MSQSNDSYRVPVAIVDVPSEIERNAGYCIVTCTYMLLRYYEKRGVLPNPSNPLPNYDSFKTQFGQYVSTLGLPPNKLRDYLHAAFLDKDFKVQHKRGSIQSLEYHIRSKTPVIPLFDYLMYQQGIAAKATHATLLTGYTEENFFANNPLHGRRYPYEKQRFAQAWAERDNKYILIIPRGVTLNSFLSHS